MRGRKTDQTHIFAGERPPNPILPKDYQAYSVEQMFGMLDSALKTAGSCFIENHKDLIDQMMSAHAELKYSLAVQDFKQADRHLASLTNNNILVLMANALINHLIDKHRVKYGSKFPPDRDFFRQATALLRACKSAVNENLFNEVYGSLTSSGLMKTVEDISKLLSDFQSTDFAIFLSQKRVALAPIPQPNKDKVTQHFFKPEMMYLFDCDVQPAIDNSQQEDAQDVTVQMTHRYQ